LDAKKLFNLSNKVIILTGAGGLLGSKYAEGLSQVNANVVLADRNFSKIKQMQKSLNEKYNVDLVDLFLKILTNKQSINQIFNVGSLDNISIKEFSENVSTICQNDVKIIQNEPLKFENIDFKPNINKLKNILDFSPETNLQDGIKKTIKWFEQNLDENKN